MTKVGKAFSLLITYLIFVAACEPVSPLNSEIQESSATVFEKIPTTTPTVINLAPTPTAEPATPTLTAIPPSPIPDVPFEAVSFTTEDGVEIAATLIGDGDRAILLLHMGKGAATGNNQEDWHPFARFLADRGYSVLTPDFRGRGDSGGEFVNDPLMLDAQAGIEFLRGRGVTRFICIGAGVGGTTCMHIATTESLEGLVVLSSSLQAGPTNLVTESDLAQLSIPKLFLYGERDGFGFPEAMENIYQKSAQPKELITCDTAAHGSDLLYGTCGEDIHQQILTFLEGIG